MIPHDLHQALVRICGRDAVIVDPNRLLVYESDGLTAHRHSPSAVVLPANTDEVRDSVRRIREWGFPIVPRGAGTGLSGGAVALNDAIIIGTARMNRILQLDVENRRAVLQPGVINAALSEAAKPHGLFYAPDPSSQTACTIGGNVAENSGGPHCLKYGVTSRYVRGLKVVLPDGSLVTFGGQGREGRGFDLVGLFVGSEGCFGIATEIEVGLLPLPEGVRTLLGIFDRVEDAGQAVSNIISQGLLPAAMEIIDGQTIRAVEASRFAAGYPTDAEGALVVEFDGPEAGLDDEAAAAREICLAAGAREVRAASTEAERMALWKGRKKAFGAMGRIAPDLLVQDATVPRTRLPSVLAGIAEVADRYKLTVANVFHAGDGNLHPNILFDRRNQEELARVEKASKEIMALCVEAGGTITGEHGVGLDKKDHMRLIYDDAVLEAMWAVRRVLDPDGVMNPGKVLPDESMPADDWLPEPEVNRGDPYRAIRRPSPDRLDDVVRLFPSDRVMTGESARAWIGSPLFGIEAVVFPESVREVQSALEVAARHGLLVAPAGAGSWLGGGGWVSGADIVISTERMTRITDYEPADLTLTAEAGLSWHALKEALAVNQQWLPIDPPGVGAGTLGGVTATGRSGSLGSFYGGPRDNVLGLDVVTSDGRHLRLGGKVVKNVAGYDLVRLLVGSHGSLGVITGVSVRLFPRPASDVTLIYGSSPMSVGPDLVDLARRAAGCALHLAAVELWDDPSPTLAIRVLGSAALTRDVTQKLSQELGAEPALVVEGAESAKLHEHRDGWERRAGVVARISLLPNRLPKAWELAERLRDRLGDGRRSVHVAAGLVRVRGDSPAPDDVGALAAHIRGLREEVRALGGTLVLSKAPEELGNLSGWSGGLGSRESLTRGLERVFDPVGIFAPRIPGGPVVGARS